MYIGTGRTCQKGVDIQGIVVFFFCHCYLVFISYRDSSSYFVLDEKGTTKKSTRINVSQFFRYRSKIIWVRMDPKPISENRLIDLTFLLSNK